jgi:hypothetical protein
MRKPSLKRYGFDFALLSIDCQSADVGDSVGRARLFGGYTRGEEAVSPGFRGLMCRRQEAIENINEVMEEIRAEVY